MSDIKRDIHNPENQNLYLMMEFEIIYEARVNDILTMRKA